MAERSDPLPIRTHGPSGYNRGCRCEVCTTSTRERRARYRPPPVGRWKHAPLARPENCQHEGCSRPCEQRSWCHAHYELRRKRGLLDRVPVRQIAWTCSKCCTLMTFLGAEGREPLSLPWLCPACGRRKDGPANKRYKEGRRRLFQASAGNARKQWTGADLEIALRSDLSIAEAAAVLGRSLQAVQHKRILHKRDDPKTFWLAGVGQNAKAGD